jgi:NADH-quinone oxidoreductase subunit N
MDLGDINEAVRNDSSNQTLMLIGLGMLAVGLLFKVGAAPFQAWTPDVYQGAPTAVTAFMSAATKTAAFGAIMRLFYVAFGADRWSWQPMMWVVAILSMLVGAVLAVTQRDVKRMLAYSAIAHTGFLLTGVLGVQSAGDLTDGQLTSLQAVLFYLVTYGVAALGAFAVVSLVRDSAGEQSALARWAGLGKHSPLVAGVFALFMLGLAGIPLTSGFIGKWAVFEVAMSSGAWPVVIVGVISSMITAFIYVYVIVVMFFRDPEPGTAAYVVHPSVLTSATIAVGAAATLVLGIIPGPVLNLAGVAGQFLR